MSPLIKYARLCRSFSALYGDRGSGEYDVAVAAALTGVLALNGWTVALIALSFCNPQSSAVPSVDRASLLFVASIVFFGKLALIKYIRRRSDRDPAFHRATLGASVAISHRCLLVSGSIFAFVLIGSLLLKRH